MSDFELVRWSVNNLFVPMFRINATGQVVTTTKGAAGALGVTEDSLRSMFYQHRSSFNLLSTSVAGAKDFLAENKIHFNIIRAKNDMHLWTPRQIVRATLYVESATAEFVLESMLDLIEAEARLDMVSKEEHAALMGRVDQIEASLHTARPALQSTASALGRGLAAQRKTKHLRLV